MDAEPTKIINGVTHYYDADWDGYFPEYAVREFDEDEEEWVIVSASEAKEGETRFKLDPELKLYFKDEPYEADEYDTEIMSLTDEEHAEKYGTKYGNAWKETVLRTYQYEIAMIGVRERFEITARQMDIDGSELYDTLSKQYDKRKPKPQTDDFSELAKWRETKEFMINGEVMREIVIADIELMEYSSDNPHDGDDEDEYDEDWD